MSKDLHMKMDDRLAADIQIWADRHHVSFTAAVHALCSMGLDLYSAGTMFSADADHEAS